MKEINASLMEEGIYGCIDLSAEYPTLGQSGLFAVTEVHSACDIDRLAVALEKILG